MVLLIKLVKCWGREDIVNQAAAKQMLLLIKLVKCCCGHPDDIINQAKIGVIVNQAAEMLCAKMILLIKKAEKILLIKRQRNRAKFVACVWGTRCLNCTTM